VSHGFVNLVKIPKIQISEPKSRSTPELDESQQMFYEFLEHIELKKRTFFF
jgi:hypothetical protein